MDIDQLLSYFKAVLPLAIAHVAIPPLSYFESPRQFPPSELRPLFDLVFSFSPDYHFDPKFVRSLLLDKSTQQNSWGINHTNFTHLFVHKDYNHLINNLFGTVFLGWNVYLENGGIFLYSVYLIGGVFASLPMMTNFTAYLSKPFQPGEDREQSLWNNLLIGNGSLSDYVGKIVKTLGIDMKYLSCGSSGAVAALLGSDVASSIIRILRLCQKYYSKTRSKNSFFENDLISDSLTIFSCFAKFYFVYDFLSSEFRASEFQKKSQDYSSSFLGRIGLYRQDLVDHQAHLQGFTVGFVLTCLKRSFRQ